MRDPNDEPAVPRPTAPAGAEVAPMGEVVRRGVAWTSIAWGIGIVASFLSQLVLGWKLSKEDFARLGVIMTIASLGLTLADAGLRKVLVSRPRDIQTTAWPAFVIALVCNSLVAIVMIALAYWGGPAYFGRDDLTLLASVFAFMIVVGTFGVAQSAILSIDQRFKWMAGVVAVGNVGRHLMAATLALLGAGVYAYVVPMAVILIFNLAASVYQVGWVKRRPAPGSVYRGMLIECVWIQLAAFATMVTMTGDYWVGVRQLPSEQFGDYYFGFQLAQSVSAAVTSVLLVVLTPTFARLREDGGRQRGAIRATNALVSSSLVLVSIAGVMLSPLAVHLVWHGKWDSAIFVIQAVMPLLWSRSLFAIGQSVLDAGAHWALNLLMTLAYAGLLLGGALLGLWLGAFSGFVAGVVAAHLLCTLTISALMSAKVGCHFSQWLGDALIPFAIGAAVFAGYLTLSYSTHRSPSLPWWSAACVIPVIALYLLALGLASPRHWMQLRSLTNRLRKSHPGNRTAA